MTMEKFKPGTICKIGRNNYVVRTITPAKGHFILTFEDLPGQYRLMYYRSGAGTYDSPAIIETQIEPYAS
jgi:hypothetical protein